MKSPRPAATVSLRTLTGMQILRAFPRPTELESLGQGLKTEISISPSSTLKESPRSTAKTLSPHLLQKDHYQSDYAPGERDIPRLFRDTDSKLMLLPGDPECHYMIYQSGQRSSKQTSQNKSRASNYFHPLQMQTKGHISHKKASIIRGLRGLHKLMNKLSVVSEMEVMNWFSLSIPEINAELPPQHHTLGSINSSTR